MAASSHDKTLTLLVAGLFGPGTAPAAAGPQTPALLTLLARGERLGPLGNSLEAVLFSLFHAETPDEGDLPVAAVTRIMDLAVIDKGWWLRADPVHLTPDRDRLILTDATRIDVTAEEAARLAAEIGEVYGGDGWVLKAPRPGRWYLKPARAPKMTTTPLAEVVGRDIHPYLPQGKDGKAWHTVLNEVQILLHTARVNEEREQRGQLPINSLWFWGGGRLPKIGEHGLTQLWSAEPVGLGLARLSGAPSASVPGCFDDWRAQAGRAGEHLVVLDDGRGLLQQGDLPGWHRHLDRLERHWFGPALRALKERALGAVRLINEGGQGFAISPARARQWWRWRRSLSAYR